MLEIYPNETGKTAVSHPEVSPLVETIRESLAVFALDPNRKPANGSEKPLTLDDLLRSPVIREALKHRKGSEKSVAALPVFFEAYKRLTTMEHKPDIYKAIIDAITETQNQYGGITDQETTITADIEQCKQVIAENEKKIPLALASGDIEFMAELEQRNEELAVSIKLFTLKRSAVGWSTRFILDGLLRVLNEAEREILNRYRQQRAKEIIPAYEKAKAEFLKACEQIKNYAPAMIALDRGNDAYGRKLMPPYGVLWAELVKEVNELPAYSVDAKAELLRAA